MLPSNSSKLFIRWLRTQNKRITNSLERERVTGTSLSEADLQALQNRDQPSLTQQIDRPLIEKISVNREEKAVDSLLSKNSHKEILSKYVKAYSNRHQHLREAPTVDNQFEILTEAVIPFYKNKTKYQKQLVLKQKRAENVFNEFSMMQKIVESLATSATLRRTNVKLPCPVEYIIGSPKIFEYRNRDEFKVFLGADGNPKTVGYLVGLPSDPFTRCIPPDPLVSIKESHKLVAKHFQEFIRASPLKTCLQIGEEGVWRGLTVRSNRKGDLLACVHVHSTHLTSEEKETLKNDLRQYFFSGPGTPCGVTSLYLQACPRSKCLREESPFELIEGSTHIVEEFGDIRLRVLPDSNLQINEEAADLFYHSIQKLVGRCPATALLDIYCGSGDVSQILAPNFRHVIGIDPLSSAVEDAQFNARQNGIQNASYILGTKEDLIDLLEKDTSGGMDTTALINPIRAGLHSSVIEAIRKCQSIKKVIYVSSKLERNVWRNLSLLVATLRPRHWKTTDLKKGLIVEEEERLTDPFVLKYAIPIDLYPHTQHIEYILLFERVIGT